MTFDVISKDWSTWNLRVINPNDVNISMEYNKKMANEDDAREWKNLVDVASFSISANSILNDIKVDENWFATHIAISFVYEDLRYITAANHIQTGLQPSYWFAYQWEKNYSES